MNTCDTCKWWDTEDKHSIKDCNQPKLQEQEAEDSVFACNEVSYYGGILSTGPKFGCIHHEPK